MRTRTEIDESTRDSHDRLTRAYYQDGAMSKAEFDRRHAQLWIDQDAELRANGHYLPAPTPRAEPVPPAPSGPAPAEPAPGPPIFRRVINRLIRR